MKLGLDETSVCTSNLNASGCLFFCRFEELSDTIQNIFGETSDGALIL